MFSSSRTRTGDHALAGEFESSNSLLASDGRKLRQELVKSVAALQVVEQRLHWHTGPDEHGRAAEDLRVAVNHREFSGHDPFCLLVYGRVSRAPSLVVDGLPERRTDHGISR